MGLLPSVAHNGQRRFREVPALPALCPQPALLGKSNNPTHQQVGTAGRRFLQPLRNAPNGTARHELITWDHTFDFSEK